jgi:tetratricopeptide (TPR) repeat protein
MVAGCGGGRKSAAPRGADRYRRAPIKEVSEQQLKADGMLIDALALQESGRNEEALNAYRRLAEAHPDYAAAWYGMSQLLVQRGWTDSAEACARRAVKLGGDNVWYQLALAQCQSARGDAKGLAATWEAIVKQHPETIEYYYELSNAYINANDLPKAVEALNRVEHRIGITEPISIQKQKLWNAAGKPDKAMREVEALADAMPHEKRYQAILAEMHMQQKHYSKAKSYYDRILKTDPDDPYIHIQLAEYHKAVGNAAEADSEMVRAFDNRQLDAKTKLQLLASFYSEEEFYGSHRETTFRLMDKAMGECTDSTQYAIFYGDVLMRQGKYAEAARQLELGLTVDSSRYEVWEALLICLTEVPERKASLASYALRASKLFPMHTLPHYLIAMNHYEEKRYDEALKSLETITKWGFSNGYLEGETLALTAECYYRSGQYDKTWKQFDRILAKYPNDMATLNNYAYYLAEQGIELEKAERMSRRTIEADPDNANSLDTYGWILHLLGRDRDALPYLEKAVRLDPKSDTLHDHLETVKKSLP